MELVNLGRSSLPVPRLWLGTVNFSGRMEDAEAHRLMDAAVERGVTCIDTADMYGWRVHKGHTEELIGAWLRDRGRRDDVLVATKVGEAMSDRPGDRGLSARHIIESCEGSLRRLGVDHLDLLQMHRVDPHVRWEEVWTAMDQLVASGKVRYVGSSNFAGWRLAAAQEEASRRGSLGIVTEQCLYNLAVRHPELEVLPAAQAYCIGVFVWSPLHGGLLSGALRKLADGTAVKSAQGRAQQLLPAVHDQVARYEELCAEHGLDPSAVGLAWVLSRPGVSGAVIGPRTVDQLDGAIDALALDLEATGILPELESLFGPVGRGGEAPEAWQ